MTPSDMEHKIRDAMPILKQGIGPSDMRRTDFVVAMRDAAWTVFVYSTILADHLAKSDAESKARWEQKQADEQLLATLKRIGIASAGGTVDVRG